ncbi:MAG: beta-lactamase family protein [Xanthomonadales bacterium]|nr:beta-lactamase family protein [Xanthomonadales bacterium]
MSLPRFANIVIRLGDRLRLPILLLCLGPGLAACATQTVGQQREGVLFWTQAQRDVRFAQMDKLFPSDRVARGTLVHALPPGPALLPRWQDASITLKHYMHKNHVVGVMVLQHGKIRLQRYAPGFAPQQHWTSFSVAKSFTSTLLGIALRQGYIHSLDDSLVTYIPSLHGSAYADVTIRQLLTMTSGVRWNEDYSDPQSDVAQMYQSACHGKQPLVLTYLKKMPRAWPAGSHWNYNTAETDLLGILVQRATQRSLATYLAQTIWQPYGMASDAFWLKDQCDGSDTGGSGLSATLADYARMGQFMLDGGRIDGKPIIAKAWMHGAMQRQQHVDAPGRGYGYLWGTDADGSYAAIGIFGQLLYIDPSRQLVIAQVAAWPHADTEALVAGRRAFVAAVKRGADQSHSASSVRTGK